MHQRVDFEKKMLIAQFLEYLWLKIGGAVFVNNFH